MEAAHAHDFVLRLGDQCRFNLLILTRLLYRGVHHDLVEWVAVDCALGSSLLQFSFFNYLCRSLSSKLVDARDENLQLQMVLLEHTSFHKALEERHTRKVAQE